MTISYLSFFSVHAGSDSNHVVTFSSWIPHTHTIQFHHHKITSYFISSTFKHSIPKY